MDRPDDPRRDVHKRFGRSEVLKGCFAGCRQGRSGRHHRPVGLGQEHLPALPQPPRNDQPWRIDIEGETLVSAGKDAVCRYAPEADIRRICRRMGMVFQHFNLFPHLTVLQNIIEAPITVKGLRRAEIVPVAEGLLRKVGLLDKQASYPSRLSGGQKQRVAIARALAMDPDIMLFDEPTSALDPELTGEVLRTIRELAEEHMTMLVVTHEMAFAREVASRVVFMDGGEIIEARPARELFSSPEHARTRAFLENML
jgi:polar amino acid transport system ATP-binding protein